MRSRILTKSKHFIDAVIEKIMEWYDYLYSICRERKYEQCNLTEVYTIRGSVAENDFVQNFIKERSRIIGRSRYKISIEIDNNYKETEPEEIGKVSLYCKEKHIDEARLITKPEENEKNRLIYWKFNK